MTHGLSCSPWSTWGLPGPGIKPMSPALAGGFLSTVPPGKPSHGSPAAPRPELLVAGRVCLGAQGGHHRQDQLLAGAARPPSLPPHPSQGFIFPAHQPRRTPHLHHSLGKELFIPPFANEKTEVQNKYILLDISESEEQGLPPLKPSDP